MTANRRFFRRLAWLFATLASACGGSDNTPSPDATAGPPDATAVPNATAVPDATEVPDAGQPDAGAPTRSFALASTGAQIRLEGGLALYPADLATDVDVAAIHQDFYGVPWDEFRLGTPLPATWVAAMDELAQRTRALHKPVFLSLSVVQGPGRHFLADKAYTGDDGKLHTQTAWSAECYDFALAPDGPAMRAAYIAYVQWMIDRFDPKWINVAVEINIFDFGCSAAWDSLVDVERAAYAAAKAAKPGIIAFPSFQIDLLYGMEKSQCPAPMKPTDCYDANYARLGRLARDRFAISTYPYLIDAYADIDLLPADWFVRGALRGHEALLVAETGWLATNAVGTLGEQCVTAIAETPADQLAYFNRVVSSAEASHADLVTWWSNRDLVPSTFMTNCPCTFDQSWCAIIAGTRQQAGSDPMAQFFAEMGLKIFGSMGLRDYDGNPRPAFWARWKELRSIPLAGP
jgi:hypothetical protein